MHGDAGFKEAIAEAQLHEHQDPGKADARQRHRQTGRLPGQQHQRKRNAPLLPEREETGPDGHGVNRAITFRPARSCTLRASSGSKAKRTSTTRASASPVGSVESTAR